MNIITATRSYEAWLAAQTTVVKTDLRQKHRDMRSDPFIFLRATFYRWTQIWPGLCADLGDGPSVLSVGDLHVENFGTWRDSDGRLIWGVNDFDEVYPLPYTNDLVRLATSVALAIRRGHLDISLAKACDALLEGYEKGLTEGGRPFVLEERHGKLRHMAIGDLKSPKRFWDKLDRLPTVNETVPADAIAAIERLMPEKGVPYRIVHRKAGEGSLGRQRYLALCEWKGGRIAREAKAVVPSACVWAKGTRDEQIRIQELVDRAVQCPDPFLLVAGSWVVRRKAPDCSRIELLSLPEVAEERSLLKAMGRETANIHLGTAGQESAVLRDLRRRPGSWLRDSAADMTAAVRADFDVWRKRR